PVSVRKGHAANERLLRRVCVVLAPVARDREADRDQGSKAVAARHHPPSEREPSGELRGAPALLLLRRQQPRPNERRGSAGLRCGLVRAHAVRHEDRPQLNGLDSQGFASYATSVSEVVRREAELRVVQAFLESTPPGPMESE